MADSSSTTPTPAGGGGKIRNFIRKNKTLSAVIGIGAVWFGWHELHKNSEGGSPEAVEGEVVGTPATYGGPVPLTSELSHEGVDSEIETVREELRREREEREELERENKGDHIETEPGIGWPNELPDERPTNPEGPTSETGAGQSVNIHGRTFGGATSYHIAGSGQTDGGKKYIEYAIQFPGRVEHWQYFTATGNWRETQNSAQGPGQNKKSGSGGSKSGGPKPNQPSTGQAPTKPSKPKQKPHISPAIPVAAPNPGHSGGGGGIDGHPNAQKTANRCVNGGVGPHTAPPGFHLFCASDGYIWRAPN